VRHLEVSETLHDTPGHAFAMDHPAVKVQPNVSVPLIEHEAPILGFIDPIRMIFRVPEY